MKVVDAVWKAQDKAPKQRQAQDKTTPVKACAKEVRKTAPVTYIPPVQPAPLRKFSMISPSAGRKNETIYEKNFPTAISKEIARAFSAPRMHLRSLSGRKSRHPFGKETLQCKPKPKIRSGPRLSPARSRRFKPLLEVPIRRQTPNLQSSKPKTPKPMPSKSPLPAKSVPEKTAKAPKALPGKVRAFRPDSKTDALRIPQKDSRPAKRISPYFLSQMLGPFPKKRKSRRCGAR
jgi:hypothetical protein